MGGVPGGCVPHPLQPGRVARRASVAPQGPAGGAAPHGPHPPRHRCAPAPAATRVVLHVSGTHQHGQASVLRQGHLARPQCRPGGSHQCRLAAQLLGGCHRLQSRLRAPSTPGAPGAHTCGGVVQASACEPGSGTQRAPAWPRMPAAGGRTRPSGPSTALGRPCTSCDAGTSGKCPLGHTAAAPADRTAVPWLRAAHSAGPSLPPTWPGHAQITPPSLPGLAQRVRRLGVQPAATMRFDAWCLQARRLDQPQQPRLDGSGGPHSPLLHRCRPMASGPVLLSPGRQAWQTSLASCSIDQAPARAAYQRQGHQPACTSMRCSAGHKSLRTVVTGGSTRYSNWTQPAKSPGKRAQRYPAPR